MVMDIYKQSAASLFSGSDFPFEIKHHRSRDGWRGIYHVHPHYIEIQYVRFGNSFFFIKDRRYQFKSRSLFIIHGQDVHCTIQGKELVPVDKTRITFSRRLLKDFPKSYQPVVRRVCSCRKGFPHRIQLDEENAVEMEMIIDALQKEWNERSRHFRIVILANLAALVALIDRAASTDANVRDHGEEHNPLIADILAYIEARFREPVSRSTVSEHIHRSPCYVSDLFKKSTGLSLKEYLAHRRVDEAKRLLEQERGKKIITIAYEAGFSNLWTFNRTFKKITGTTPSEYLTLCV